MDKLKVTLDYASLFLLLLVCTNAEIPDNHSLSEGERKGDSSFYQSTITEKSDTCFMYIYLYQKRNCRNN